MQLGVQLEQLITDLQQYADWVKNGPDTTHVFAIERGIAVRIIFDVQLTTTDSQLSASFGIANLSAALARNEANVEVSYEVTGTAIDPLPEEAIIITSVNEYLEAFKKFHAAVSLISRAWEAHAKGESKVKVPATGTEDPETLLPTRVRGREKASRGRLPRLGQCHLYAAERRQRPPAVHQARRVRRAFQSEVQQG